MAINIMSFLNVFAKQENAKTADASSSISKANNEKNTKSHNEKASSDSQVASKSKSKFVKDEDKNVAEKEYTAEEIAKQEEEISRQKKAMETVEEIRQIVSEFEDFYNRESNISNASYSDTGLHEVLSNKTLFDMFSKQGAITVIALLFSENVKVSDAMSKFINKLSKINHKLAVKAIHDALDSILEFWKKKQTDITMHQIIIDSLHKLLEKNGYKEIHRYCFLIYQSAHEADATKNEKLLKEMLEIMEKVDFVNFDEYTVNTVKDLCYHYYTFLLKIVSMLFSPNSMLTVSDYFISLLDKYPNGFPRLDMDLLKMANDESKMDNKAPIKPVVKQVAKSDKLAPKKDEKKDDKKVNKKDDKKDDKKNVNKSKANSPKDQ